VSLEFHAGNEAELDTKSADAFRTISEVAEDLDIPQHVLRFWETRFSQIKPLKRGGGRRYYRPDDVALLKGIRRLLYGEGYTIKGLQRILKEQGPRHVQAGDRPAGIRASDSDARSVHAAAYPPRHQEFAPHAFASGPA
jgi:DNA-binding transcriptional MerR regulator